MRYHVNKLILIAFATLITTPALGYFAHTDLPGPAQTEACVYYKISQQGKVLQSGRAEFPVSDFEYEHGMKHRLDLPQDAAMIFDVGNSQYVEMWMKDTPSALDMIFFGPDGTMVYATQAEPLSKELISAPGNPSIRFVMELPAGRANEINLQAGASHLSVSQPIPCVE